MEKIIAKISTLLLVLFMLTTTTPVINSASASNDSHYTTKSVDGNKCKLVLKYQQDNVQYWVNNVEKGPMDTPPVNVNSRLFLVVRYVTQEITGTRLAWDGVEKKITITTRDNHVIELWVGSPDAKVDGVSRQIDPMDTEVVPFIDSGRTLLPMRFIAENLGATSPDDIIWFDDTKIVELRFDDPECDGPGETETVAGWQGAGGSLYVGDAITQPGDINVSRNNGISTTSHERILALDSQGYPHITWSDDTSGNNEIFYVRWDNTDWVCADGSVYNPATSNANMSNNSGASSFPSLALDENDNPHITWSDDTSGNDEIFYVRWNDTVWVCADGSKYDPSNKNVDISRNSGDSEFPSLTLDDNNNPHIAWDDETFGNDEIFYVRWDNANWVCADGSIYDPLDGNANVSNSSGRSYYPVLILDNKNNIHISWWDETPGNFEIYYVRWGDASWVCADDSVYDSLNSNVNVSKNRGSSMSPSLALDSNNNPHITWWDRTPDNSVIIYIRWNSSNWVCNDGEIYNPISRNAHISDNSGNSSRPSLCLDDDNNPHMTWGYTYSLYREIFYVRWNGVNWVRADGETYNPATININVSNNKGESKFAYLALDNSGNPHITWFDKLTRDNSDILYIHYVP